MCVMPSCLVDRGCKVYAKNGVHSHSDLAIKFGIEEDKCLKYEFKLETRTLFQDFAMDHAPFPAKASHDAAAQAWFDRSVGTPQRLIAFVKKGNFAEDVLTELLSQTGYKSYTKAIKTHERANTKAIAVAQKEHDKIEKPANKRYLEALDKLSEIDKVREKIIGSIYKVYAKLTSPADKTFNKSIDSADKALEKAKASAWIEVFSNPDNRIPIWKS